MLSCLGVCRDEILDNKSLFLLFLFFFVFDFHWVNTQMYEKFLQS